MVEEPAETIERLKVQVAKLTARVAELEFYQDELRRELEVGVQKLPFHLTPMHGLIAALFLKHRNTVLSKEAIWLHLYGAPPPNKPKPLLTR